jgi:GTP-binding protein YchF
MALRCGIVGLPNVGKSTLFNALTAAAVPAENYPFCTIEPNAGIVAVPDARLAALDAIVHSARVVPATVELVDIAGLVRGASKGEGLGNQFLAHIRETHAIVLVLRCFEDPDVTHVDGSVDPLRDAETIETELALADLDTVERRAERLRRAAKAPGKEGEAARAELELLERLVAWLSAGAAARSCPVPDELRGAFRELQLLTAKPVLYLANVDEAGSRASAAAEAVERYADERGAGALRLCAKLEAELAELAPDEKDAFLAELQLEEPGPRPARSRRLRAPRPDHLLHRRPQGGARLDRPARHPGPPGGGRDPQRLRAHLHPRRGDRVRGLRGLRGRGGRAGEGQDAGRGQGLRGEGRRRAPLPGRRVTPEEALLRYSAGPKAGVFTDGACEGNPGPGGWSAVWVDDDRVVEERCGGAAQTTNNRMELSALIEALRMLPEDADLVVYSDSNLCVQTVNEWAAGWERRGWRRKTGPIANLELVQELWGLAQRHPRVRIRWIKAHDGSRWNEYADALAAREAAHARRRS